MVEQSSVNQATTQATSTGANAMTSAAGIVLVWLLSLWKIDVPAQVALAIVTLIAPFVHYGYVWLTMPAVTAIPPPSSAAR